MPSNRIDKVNSLLKREISQIIQRDVAFPDGVLVTLTDVKATPNLIEARAYISALPEDKIGKVMQILDAEIYEIQQKINRKLNMRPIPKIKFVKEQILAEAGKVEKLLHELKNQEK